MGLEGAKGEEGMKVKKGRQQAKICPNESSRLLIYVVLWVSLYFNQRRWGDLSNVTPMGLCVCLFIRVCIAPHFYSPSSRCSCLLQSKLTSEFDRTHSPVVR